MQRDAAKKPGLTESAVSQYMKSKRGHGMNLMKRSMQRLKVLSGISARQEMTLWSLKRYAQYASLSEIMVRFANCIRPMAICRTVAVCVWR